MNEPHDAHGVDEPDSPGGAGTEAGKDADALLADLGLARTDGIAGYVVEGLRRGPSGSGDAGRDELDALIAAAAARADAADLVDIAWTVADTPIGRLTLTATEVGVLRISFGTEEHVLDELAVEVSPRVLHLPSRLDDLRRQLDEYFAGRRHRFELPLDRRLSRGFRARALEALAAHIGYGETASYKDVATLVGNPKATRAVGTAMATNPIPIVVPCHRVLRSGGALGNYGGGPEIKAWLLRHEGARILL